MVIMGDSAGGHLASLAGAYLGYFKGIISWSGVVIPANAAADRATDQKQALSEKASEFWGYSQATVDARHYIDAYGPMRMLMIGSTDEWVDFDQQGRALCTYDRAAAGDPSICATWTVAGDLHGTKIRDAHPDVADAAESWARTAINS